MACIADLFLAGKLLFSDALATNADFALGAIKQVAASIQVDRILAGPDTVFDTAGCGVGWKGSNRAGESDDRHCQNLSETHCD
jgi:hypothetical protein